MVKDAVQQKALESGTRWVLVRTAETGFARQGRLAGDVDLPLTDRGRSASRRILAEVLRPLGGVDAVFTAENQGAQETAQVLAEADSHRIRVLPRLNGVSLGLWEGQLGADLRHRHTRMFGRWRRDPLGFTPPEGESILAASARVGKAVQTIRKKHPRGTVAVVAPATVISLLWCHLRGKPPSEVFEIAGKLRPVEVVSGPDVR